MIVYFFLITILFYFFHYTNLDEYIYDIPYLKEFNVMQYAGSIIHEGSFIILLLKVEDSYDISNLFVRFKVAHVDKNSGSFNSVKRYGYSNYPNTFNPEENNLPSTGHYEYDYYGTSIKTNDYKTMQYNIGNFDKEKLKYIGIFISIRGRTTYLSVFVFPFKIFDLNYSNEIQINSYYSNGMIPANITFYIRANIENINSSYIAFKTLHGSEINLEIKRNEYFDFPGNISIQRLEYFSTKVSFFKKTYNNKYDYYIYHFSKNINSKYIVFYIQLFNPLNYLSSIIYMNEDKLNKYINNSLSPILIAFIIILLFVIIGVISLFILKKYGFLRKYSLFSNLSKLIELKPKDIPAEEGLMEKEKD